MKRIIIIFFSIVMLGSLFLNCKRPVSDKNDVSDKVPVKVQTVKLGSVVQSIDYNGDVKAEFEVKVFSKIPDRIVELYVDEGDFVHKGDPIAKIFAATIEQGVRQAEARLAAAKAQESNLLLEYDRAKRLSKENAMSKQQYDTIEAQYQSAQAQVEQAEAALASIKSQLLDATVTAPISGIIGKRFYETGDMAAPQLPIVTIVQMDRVKIDFNATERDLGKLKIGQEAQIKVESYPEQVFRGKVSKISPVLDPLTRMAKVKVLV
ncbi:MAG: efflux RND transporter periplasmic adaptor subunit, partial [Calditrichaeota bacterium]|nr:efflux RND transporter periplasmic adaptor subunit [Calditrichota bacterium]